MLIICLVNLDNSDLSPMRKFALVTKRVLPDMFFFFMLCTFVREETYASLQEAVTSAMLKWRPNAWIPSNADVWRISCWLQALLLRRHRDREMVFVPTQTVIMSICVYVYFLMGLSKSQFARYVKALFFPPNVFLPDVELFPPAPIS